MRVLIAPDKFKHALSARGAAEAIAAGVRDARHDSQCILLPLGDGGEGTGELLAERRGFLEQRTWVSDALGRPIDARWWRSAAGDAAILEAAEAIGLARLTDAERDARRASSQGVGQLLRAAEDAGAARITLCVGGTATVDGGAGCLQALGWRFFDHSGVEIVAPITPRDLPRVESLKPPERHGAVARMALDIVCDVDNPLLGPQGAARVFGPQKLPTHHTHADVDELESALAHWARLLERGVGRDVHDIPGGGAAGGLPAGLAACCGATILPGRELIAEQLRAVGDLSSFDLVITGEGRLDEQTTRGKVVAAVSSEFAALEIPVVALVGRAAFAADASIAQFANRLRLRQIIEISRSEEPIETQRARTAENLRRAARNVVGP
ncbi:MAG: glycerate kinase [Phycisphaerae bacterium]